MEETTRRTSRRWAIGLFVVAVPLLCAGILLSFGVQLAYLTSHGSAWLSPTAERLHRQWWTGRALSLTAGLLFATSLVVGLRARAGSGRTGWWVILAGLGLGLFLTDLWFLGVTP
jgi:TRAP-type C4-dicarboxylate transport system permease small subunit